MKNNAWKVDTLNVGQADAHTLQTPAGTRVMIDADEEQISTMLDDMTIDHLLITHIHKDHVFGIQHLDSVENAHWPNTGRYTVSSDDGCVEPAVLEECVEGLAEMGISLSEIEAHTTGDKILDEEDITLTALSPPATGGTIETASQSTGYPCKLKPEKANPNGAVCKFEGPDGISGLFMGDVGDESAHNAESWLVEQHTDSETDVDLKADILYLGHHGSNKSTDETFLNAVDPAHVVISSSLDNNYTSENQHDGHPHDETLKRLHDREIDVHWTAVHGKIDTTVEDGVVTLEHDTQIETTNAADITALKYYARAHDLDQETLTEIEEISIDDLPEESPDWVRETPFVTEQAAIDPEKIDTLHELEVEHSDLKGEKYRLEGTRDELHETKAALEQESENNQGVADRLTAAVSSLWGDEAPTDGTAQEDTALDYRSAESRLTENESHRHPSTDSDPPTSEPDADTQDSEADQSEDIDATIAAYEQRNTALRAEVTVLTEEVEGLTTHVETLEQELAKPGLIDRVTAAIRTDTGDTQPTEIRRARFSETAASLADTNTKATTTTATAKEHADKQAARAQPTDHTPEQTRSSAAQPEKESSTDRSEDRGFSL